MKTKSYYKERYIFHKEMHSHYEELFNTAVKELRFERLKIEQYENIIDEVEILLDEGVDIELIKKVIDFGKMRITLDISIHNNLIGNKINNT